MPKNVKAQTAADLNDPDKTITIGELTLSGYDSTSGNVFDGSKLSELYSALTGGRGATLQDVKDELSGSSHSQYGTAVKTTLPNYKSASDIFSDNKGKNIVLNFGGQEWTVTFLTTDMDGNVIVTLWMTQPLDDNGAGGAAYSTKDGKVTAKYGWATSNYSSTISVDTSLIISNNYSTSQLRVAGLNSGNTTGSTTYHTSATATASVTLEQRLKHPLAKFTLDNSVLTAQNANKSLINYITQPFDVDYTYVLDFPFAFASTTNYFLNEALTRDKSGNIVADKLSTAIANSSVNLNGTGSSNNAWFQQGAYNYAYSANNYYNDWGSDYVWVPSVSEIGRTNSNSSFEGLWGTGGSATGQVKFNTGSTTQASSCLSGSTNTTEYVWLRSSNTGYASSAQVQSSSGGTVSCFTAGTNAVRPALHLNLTKADEAGKTMAKPTASGESSFTYDGTEHSYFPDGFNASVMNINGNTQTDAGSYTVSVTPKTGLTWSDGLTDAVEFSFRINKATPSVLPQFSGDRPYNTAGFPEPTSYTAGANGIEITGKFMWPNQSQLIEIDKSKDYTWLFTPDEEYIDNFNTVEGTATFNFQERKIESMTATFNSGGATVYTKTSTSELMKMITLTVTYNDGEVVNETNFEINYSLHEGTGNTITVSFGGQLPKIVNVDDYVVLAKVEGLVIVYSQGSNKLTPLNDKDDLKQYLTVYPQWNYTNTSAPLAADEYTLEGELTVGSPEIYVVYEGIKEVINPAPTVSKAVYDISALKFEDKLAPYTGEAY
ncbi:MAG: hypothetical protein K2J83_05180, partial [Clostridia bacterium]|nr:hypothetical protein [Clostridia bacterium]